MLDRRHIVMAGRRMAVPPRDSIAAVEEEVRMTYSIGRSAMTALVMGAIVVAAACSPAQTTAPVASQSAATAAPSTASLAPAPSAPASAPASAAAGALTFLSDWTGTDQVKFESVIKGFTDKAGVTYRLEGTSDFATGLRTRVAAGDTPMIAIAPRPGFIADYAKQGLLKSLDDLGLSTFKDSYQPAWVDLGSVDGKPYAITVKANSKSMIWDRPKDLAAAGGAPSTMDQFKALLTAGAAGDHKPLVISGKDTWTLGDWFGNVYL
jgi:ABC-type glycerol-3-phosphate transport system substrate-binding protein